MGWIFLGYASGVYLAFLPLATVLLPTHPNPPLGPYVYLLWFPLLVILFGAEMFIHHNPEDAERIKTAFTQRLVGRSTCIGVGVICGVGAVAAICLLLWTDAFGTESLIFMIIGCALIAVLSPAFAAAWLVVRAKQVMDEAGGFPVIPIEHATTRSSGRDGEAT